MINSLFDFLGFVLFVIFRGKVLLCEMMQFFSLINWDDLLFEFF